MQRTRIALPIAPSHIRDDGKAPLCAGGSEDLAEHGSPPSAKRSGHPAGRRKHRTLAGRAYL